MAVGQRNIIYEASEHTGVCGEFFNIFSGIIAGWLDGDGWTALACLLLLLQLNSSSFITLHKWLRV
jgi:hypothetical protein